MRISKISRVFLFAVTLALILVAFSYAADEKVPDMEHGESVTADVPFVGSMDNLDVTIKEIVSAAIVGDSMRVRAAVEAAYGIMDKVHSAVRSGSVKLKKKMRGRKRNFCG